MVMHKLLKWPAALKPQQRDSYNAGEEDLLALEATFCSHGDTVHYRNTPKIFERCEGSFLYDADGSEFLDLQMWYSAVNFGYRNQRLNEAAKRQLDRLPQVASQYLHREKIELATIIALDAETKFRSWGRVGPHQRRQTPRATAGAGWLEAGGRRKAQVIVAAHNTLRSSNANVPSCPRYRSISLVGVQLTLLKHFASLGDFRRAHAARPPAPSPPKRMTSDASSASPTTVAPPSNP
jgi:Aminotransferase class-III